MSPDEHVVFRDYPLALWLTAAMVVAGAFGADDIWQGLLVALVGAALIAYASVLTVTVDRRRETLHLRYRSLLRVSTKSFPFREIRAVNVAEDNEGERMYRVELLLHSGETVPLRTMYAVGRARKNRRAERIRSAIMPPVVRSSAPTHIHRAPLR